MSFFKNSKILGYDEEKNMIVIRTMLPLEDYIDLIRASNELLDLAQAKKEKNEKKDEQK